MYQAFRVPAAVATATVAAVLATTMVPAQATVIGSLANFDVVNDTGKPAYGFEIEIEDSSYDHTKIYSVFGLNRVFPSVSPDPLAVNRFGAYGAPTITDLPGFGVRITYGGTIGSTFTPSMPYTTSGDSCWPGANANWQATSCDHFGVSTIGAPAKTSYRWLVESTPGSGSLVAQDAAIPSVSFAYTPPVPAGGGAPAAPAVVNARVDAHADNEDNPDNPLLWGEPMWVKVYTTNVEHEIDLGDLLRGDADQEAAEVEVEWVLLQMAPVGDDGPNEAVEADVALGDVDEAVIRRYEFFEYLGPVNPEDGEAKCDNPDNCPGAVGNYLGAQMAGFALLAALPDFIPIDGAINEVPAPGSLGLLAGGLLGFGTLRRRRRG